MNSLIVKIVSVAFALFCIGWYVKVYEPELYTQFNAAFKSDVESTHATSGDVIGRAQPIAEPVPLSADAVPPLAWVLTEALPDNSLSIPRTSVALKVGCFENQAGCSERIIETGVFAGLCSVIERPESTNELTGVLCWFAGGGDEIGVFDEQGMLVLKRGELGEPTAESSGFRGNFVPITAL